MSKNSISEEEYVRMILEACENPFGPDVVLVDVSPTERDYLYSVWRRLGEYLQWELPMLLPHPENRSEVDILREEIHKLVAEHQAGNYPIQPTLHKQISAALKHRK